jgi:hypothetical protein
MVGAIALPEERSADRKSTLELTILVSPDNNKKHLTPLGVNHQSERGVWHTGVGEK